MLDLSILRAHQRNAVEESINNGFSSGVHFHATGTGKSWVSFYILAYFLQSYNKGDLVFEKTPEPLVVFWVCERKSILKEQFEASILKTRGFYNLLKLGLVYGVGLAFSRAFGATNQGDLIRWRRRSHSFLIDFVHIHVDFIISLKFGLCVGLGWRSRAHLVQQTRAIRSDEGVGFIGF